MTSDQPGASDDSCGCRWRYLDGGNEREWLAVMNSDLRSDLLAARQRIERLRTAGDSLAEALTRHQMACGVNDARSLVAAWKEVCCG